MTQDASNKPAVNEEAAKQLAELHGHVAEMCAYLGASAEQPPDAWTLRDLITLLKAKVKRAEEVLGEWVPAEGDRVSYAHNSKHRGAVSRVVLFAYVEWDDKLRSHNAVSDLRKLPPTSDAG